MRLTQEIARKHIGRYIDCHRRLFGYYPMQIVTVGGKLMTKDAADVYSLIPEKEMDFNCVNYDYIFEIVQEDAE